MLKDMHRASDVKTGGAVLEFTFSFIQKEKKIFLLSLLLARSAKRTKKCFFFFRLLFNRSNKSESRELCI